MNKIRILSDEVIHHIAAGEVIERPASIVKELVENSIDAGSTEITVEVKNGGRNSIKVVDNGIGMSKEDAAICWQRHATSKITSLEDISSIKTLGFRGEALAAIGAVSRTEIITRQKEDKWASSIKIEGGKQVESTNHGAAAGTQIIVKDLFFNTPARLKFLRTSSTETAKIIDVLFKFALAYPKISFKLSSNNRFLLNQKATDNSRERIVSLLGKEYEKELIHIDKKDSLFTVTGVVSKPALNRQTKDMEFIFVNGRSVVDKIITHAILAAYETLMPKGRWPISVLFITVEPRFVDVNVHPTKREVRWSNSALIHDAIKEIIRNSFNITSAKSWHVEQKPLEPIYNKDSYMPNIEKQTVIVSEEQAVFKIAKAVNILGQFNNTYIIAEWDGKLQIIDQHAAHERILFEKLSKKEKGLLNPQGLLIPMRIELTSKEHEILKHNADKLEAFGFEVADFGNKEFLVHSVPTLLSGRDVRTAIKDLLSNFDDSFESNVSITEKITKTIACRAAIMAGKSLDLTEMQRLVSQLVDSKSPYCPHGRPAIVNFSLSELEKLFHRK